MRPALGFLLALLLAPGVLAQPVRPLPAALPPPGDPLPGGRDLFSGSFEDGTPNPFWIETSTNFSSPLCAPTPPLLCGGFDGARTGSWWAWFGGIRSLDETATLSQDVRIAPTDTVLTFYLWIETAQTPATFDVSIDEDTLFSVTEADAPDYPAYTLVTLDTRPYADSTQHTLTFAGHTTAGGVTNFWLDDVALGLPEVVPTEPDPAHGSRLTVYPSPFTATAWVSVDVPTPQPVTVEVFDLLGRRVAVLFEGPLRPGGRTLALDGAALPPGLYVVRVRGDGFVETRKVVRAR